jgi:hypothetical protein
MRASNELSAMVSVFNKGNATAKDVLELWEKEVCPDCGAELEGEVDDYTDEELDDLAVNGTVWCNNCDNGELDLSIRYKPAKNIHKAVLTDAEEEEDEEDYGDEEDEDEDENYLNPDGSHKNLRSVHGLATLLHQIFTDENNNSGSSAYQELHLGVDSGIVDLVMNDEYEGPHGEPTPFPVDALNEEFWNGDYIPKLEVVDNSALDYYIVRIKGQPSGILVTTLMVESALETLEG